MVPGTYQHQLSDFVLNREAAAHTCHWKLQGDQEFFGATAELASHTLILSVGALLSSTRTISFVIKVIQIIKV